MTFRLVPTDITGLSVADELADMALLRDLSVRLVREEAVQAVYDEIVAAAVTVTHSDAGTLQIYDPPTRELVLLATWNIAPYMADHFRRVGADSRTACGTALRTGQRSFVDFDAHKDDDSCRMHVGAGLRSAQSTPLVSRSGHPIGMLNTHWHASGHRPSERELGLLDLLGRQAADLIEQRQAQEAIRRAARMDAFRVALNEALRSLTVVTEIERASIRVIEKHLAVDRVLYVETGESGDAVAIDGKRVRTDFEKPAGWFAMQDYGTAYEEIRAGRTFVSSDSQNDDRLTVAGRGALLALGHMAIVAVPLISGNRWASTLCVFDGNPRAWTTDEIRLLEEAAASIGAAIARVRAEAALRESEARLAVELNDARRLHEISILPVEGIDSTAIYERLLDVAMETLHADFGSLQMFSPVHNQLKLLAWRNFHPDSVRFWETVAPDTTSCRGVALEVRRRVIVPDAEQCLFMAGTGDLEHYRLSGIRAAQSTPLISRNGRVLGMISTHWRVPHEASERELLRLDVLARQAADLLERTQSELALRDADRRKDEFLAMLAHELRNPLAPLRTGIELLELAGDAPGTLARVRRSMERQVIHIVRLVDDLLDISRISAGKIRLQRTPTLLVDLVTAAVDAQRGAIDAAGIDLTVAMPVHDYLLDVDPTRFTQVLMNLLHNATKFTRPGGHIHVCAHVDRSGPEAGQIEVVLSVADDGVGITSELLPDVFDLYRQGPPSALPSVPGLGIGLALARQLIEMHGGHIEAISDGANQGSTFTIRMACSEQSPILSAQQRTEAVSITGRILIVDDNLDALESLAMLLELLGGDVHVAHDGATAIERVRGLRPDVIILDIGMPGLDGYETCRSLRADQAGRNAFVIALTGWGQEQDRQRAMDAGFDAHLTKPVDMEALMRALPQPVHTTRR